ncbi:MAG: ABC transporter ATP-binding protein [Clostridium sp.]
MRIEIKNLNKNFGKKQALKNVNLNIDKGMFGLLGRNGAGKTTLMRILSTLLVKTSGEITICGVDINKDMEIRNIIGYLPQEFSLYSNLSIYDNLDYLACLSNIKSRDRKKIISDVLRKVNLEDLSNVKVKTLSGGMKRRLGIAQAIMNNPKVLIVDEPTAGLDPEERIRFRNLLSEIAKDRIVILSTHIVGDIESTCESLAILDKGSVLFNGKIQELIEMARGQVYTIESSLSQMDSIKRKYNVTAMLTLGNKISFRVLSKEKPNEERVKCEEPNLEDAYMLILGGSSRV